MPKFQVNLYLETDDSRSWAPEGPGWYIDARRDAVADPPGFEVTGRIRISPAEAEQLAQVLDKFTDKKPINWSVPEDRRDNSSIHDAVRKANASAHEDLARLLAEIEQRAQAIPSLRTRLNEFGGA